MSKCSPGFYPSPLGLLARAAAVLLLVSQLARAEKAIEVSGPTMGTTYTVKASFSDEVSADGIQKAIDERLGDINQKMSTYIDDSEVSKFNEAPPNEWHPVSDETLKVVSRAREISELTGGAFDITVGPLVELWRFGSAGTESAERELPSQAEVKEVLRRVGYQKLQLQSDPPALRKTVEGLRIDLSAIAKGYAVDELVELLKTRNATALMVEIGGEVRTRGVSTTGQPWRIGIESPIRDQRKLEMAIPLQDKALASSGDYRNYFVHEGKFYSHTIDPQTGHPVEHDLCAVSIIADDCATADALATGLLVMGPDRGRQLAENHKIAGLLFTRSGSNIERTHSTEFAPYLPPAGKPSVATTVLLGAVFFGAAITLMAVGVIFGKRRIQGSCGGLAGLRDDQGKTLCEACTNPAPECRGLAGADGSRNVPEMASEEAAD